MALERALYSVQEFVRDICPMSRATFYSEVKSGRLGTVTIGRRRYIPATEIQPYIQSLLPVAAEASLESS